MNPQNSPNPSSAGGTGSTSQTLSETKTKISQTAREAASKVKEVASTTATRAKEEAQRLATDRKETAASTIGNYSSAIHDTAKSIEEKDPNIAYFAHRAADKLQSVADYMRNRDFGALRSDAEDMARRHPAAFFGGLFLAGLIIGNVVKASRRKLDETGYSDDSDYGSDWSRRDSETDTQSELTAAERSAAGI